MANIKENITVTGTLSSTSDKQNPQYPSANPVLSAWLILDDKSMEDLRKAGYPEDKEFKTEDGTELRVIKCYGEISVYRDTKAKPEKVNCRVNPETGRGYNGNFSTASSVSFNIVKVTPQTKSRDGALVNGNPYFRLSAILSPSGISYAEEENPFA